MRTGKVTIFLKVVFIFCQMNLYHCGNSYDPVLGTLRDGWSIDCQILQATGIQQEDFRGCCLVQSESHGTSVIHEGMKDLSAIETIDCSL